MRRILTPLAAAGLLAAGLLASPGLAQAQDVNASLRQAALIENSPASSRAFTPAPVSQLSSGRLSSAYRAGGAADAGPTDATPFSGSVGTVLTGSPTARSLNYATPDRDPTGAAEFGD